ncbi:MAG: TlpA disulfide reductase family protein [Bdellovibrionia bacterium]
MATHDSHPKNDRSTPVLKIFAPIFVILLLVVGGLYGIKASLPPTNPTSELTDANRESRLAALDLTQLDGKSVKIADLNAKIFLINFWATWCEACIEEMPSIVKLRESFKDRGFEVLGINVDENPKAVVPKSIQQFKMDFPVFIDPEGKLSDLFDVHAIPLTVVLRKKGEILAVVSGGRDWNSAEVRAKLERWLNG